MAKDIKLDDYGDLKLDTGDAELVEEEEELVQFVETKILKVFDEDVYALEKGTDWFQKMYDFLRDEAYKALHLKGQILPIPEVRKITQLDMSLDTDTGVKEVDVTIDSIYSDTPLKVNA